MKQKFKSWFVSLLISVVEILHSGQFQDTNVTPLNTELGRNALSYMHIVIWYFHHIDTADTHNLKIHR